MFIGLCFTLPKIFLFTECVAVIVILSVFIGLIDRDLQITDL